MVIGGENECSKVAVSVGLSKGLVWQWNHEVPDRVGNFGFTQNCWATHGDGK